MAQGSLILPQENIENVHNVEQTEKMVRPITSENDLRQHVGELVLGINVFDLDFWVHVDSVK